MLGWRSPFSAMASSWQNLSIATVTQSRLMLLGHNLFALDWIFTTLDIKDLKLCALPDCYPGQVDRQAPKWVGPNQWPCIRAWVMSSNLPPLVSSRKVETCSTWRSVDMTSLHANSNNLVSCQELSDTRSSPPGPDWSHFDSASPTIPAYCRENLALTPVLSLLFETAEKMDRPSGFPGKLFVIVKLT